MRFDALPGPKGIGSGWILAMILHAPLSAQVDTAYAPGDLVRVASGSFVQGSPPDEEGRAEHEGPIRTVDVGAFYLSRFEVTVADFRQFVDATGYRTAAEQDVPIGENPASGCFSHRVEGEPSAGWVAGRSWSDPGYVQGDDHPVVCVSWRDAQAYVSWLSAETGRRFRLPTESELEYVMKRGSVAEGGHGTSTGAPCSRANVADRALLRAVPAWNSTMDCEDGYAWTAPVGFFPTNGFGVHDLVGNTLEWTQDCWHDSYENGPVDGTAWEAESGSECSRRVLRGGDFVSPATALRAAFRTWVDPDFRTYHVGFRVAMDASELP